MDCQDFKEIISAHIDGTLTARETSEVQTHLRQCPRCTKMAAWEAKANKLLKQRLSLLSPRYELKQRLLEQLGEASGSQHQGWLCMPRAWIPAFCFLSIIIGVLYFAWPLRTQQDVFTDTVIHYRQASQGPVELVGAPSSSPTARLLDLSPWGYKLLRKETRHIRGQEKRIFVYRGEQDNLLVAQEVEGTSLTHPRESDIVRKSGRDFVSTNKGDIQLVAWQDKNVVCVLASKLSKDRMIGLAEQIATRG